MLQSDGWTLSNDSEAARCCARFSIASFEGRISVNGLDPLRDGQRVRSLIGYVPQSGGLHGDLTVRETLCFWSAVRGMPKLTDEDIAKAIQYGGAIKGMPMMPSNPALKGADLAAVVAFTRSLSDHGSSAGGAR